MIEHMLAEAFSANLKQIFFVLFQILTSSKTTKYIKGLLVFFFVFFIKNGGSSLIQMIDSIQPGLWLTNRQGWYRSKDLRYLSYSIE